jgi:site-specific DNA-methyltransferase (adenine-specific)
MNFMGGIMKIDEKTFKLLSPNLKALFVKLPNPGSDEVVGLFPDTKSGALKPYKEHHVNASSFKFERDKTFAQEANSGSASRFFYCAKASKSERNMGCEGLEEKETNRYGDFEGTPEHAPKKNILNANNHPTVKPLALMRYLCRLVTPPDGVVLDPFCGSGSTLVASLQEGFKYIGIEKEPEYVKIAYARTKHALRELGEVNEWEVCDQTANQSSLVAW